MGVFSGKFGHVDGQSTVRNWTINQPSTPPSFAASNTQGGMGRRGGVRDWTGQFSNYGATPTVMPGDSFTFTGYTAPDGGTPGGSGEVLTGAALVDSVVITWNWQNGEIIGHQVNFGGHLALTEQSSSVSVDSSQPDVPTFNGTKIKMSTDEFVGMEEEIPNLTSATLTITAENQTYVNSDTVVSGVTWTGRKAGNIDWTLAMNQEDNAKQGSTGIPTIGSRYNFRLFDDATSYWDLLWGHVVDFTNLNVDRETGAIISRTINVAMDGFDGTSTGKITLPGAGSNFWPA